MPQQNKKLVNDPLTMYKIIRTAFWNRYDSPESFSRGFIFVLIKSVGQSFALKKTGAENRIFRLLP